MSIQMTLALTREQFRLDVDISVPIDGVTAISGPSGAGKTSLLRCIAGLEPDCRGQIRLNQSSWHNGKHWLKPEYRRVGYVMQQAELFPHLDVAGNIRFAQQRAKAEELIDIQQVIRVFEIEELLTRMPYSLSGGQKQRVAIVRALASQPQILLLDEPFSSLDYTLKLTMYGYFEQMLKVCPLPVFLVSHDMHEIARLSDRVLAMVDGQVTGLNDTAQALNDLQGPLTLCENARSVIHGQISQHEPQFGLTSVKVGQQVIQVPQVNASVDEQIKVIIDPCDVSLHLDHDSHTSILNQLECQVLDWRNNDETSMMIQLGFEQQTLLCKISVKSFHCLQIAQGIPIIAQVKSVSLT